MMRVWAAAIAGGLAVVSPAATGDAPAGPLAVVVSVGVAPRRDVADLGRALSALRAQGAAGVLLCGAGVDAATAPALASLGGDGPVELWVAADFPGDVSPAATACGALPCTGLALVLPPPQGEPLPHTDLAPLLERRRAGEALAERVRAVRLGLAPERRLALCVPLANTRPETSRGYAVDVGGLIRDGTVTTVVYSGDPAWNAHRARLLTDRPLRVAATVSGAHPGAVQDAVLAACSNPTLDALWLCDMNAAHGLALVRDTLAAREAAVRLEASLAEALAAGRAKVILEVPEKRGNNQATVHGVAQCFTPTAAGGCTAVQVYAALRLKGDAAPTPLRVELRADRDGRPGDQVLAAGTIPAVAFGHEPSYRWGTVCFAPAPALAAGQRYWVYLPANEVYVWRLVSAGATSESHAWSCRYDYGTHTWVLRVLCESRTP